MRTTPASVSSVTTRSPTVVTASTWPASPGRSCVAGSPKPPASGAIVVTVPSPRETASRLEESGRLAAQIERLPERQRLAILLVYGEDMSQKEAARAMEISPKAFESLLIRARAGLKQLLEEERS